MVLYRSALSSCRSVLRSAALTTSRRQAVRALSTSSSGFDTVGVVGLGLMGHGICQVVRTVVRCTFPVLWKENVSNHIQSH